MSRRAVDARAFAGEPEQQALDLDLSDTEYAVRALMREAKEARTDLTRFYGFVMRHELTKELLTPTPHQRLMFSFVEHHPWCVVRLPVSTGKTFGMAAMALWLLGNDITQRGAVVSETQKQAMKPLSMVADYILEPALNARLALVFPWLKRSPRPQDQWTQSEITAERPPGIRDPSVLASGIEGVPYGSRWSWLVSDDLVDDENSMTPAARDKIASKFDGKLISRLDPQGSRAVVTNTPWNREDQTYHLENEAGWPTITMDIYGNVRVSNADASWMRRALKEHIRSSTVRLGGSIRWYRLKAHDPDPDEQTPLWAARYSAERIREIRYGKGGKGGMLPREFARTMLCDPLDEDAARCQRDWVEKCKQRGMGLKLVARYDGPNSTYTGLDIGVGPGKQHDRSVLFTIERQPDGSRLLLDVESGRWQGPTIIDKLINKTDQYGSLLAVETVTAQDFIRQFALKKRKDLQVRAHTTGPVNKHHLDFGVESVFGEMKNEAWIIPCDEDGKCHEEVQMWIDDMLYYQPPPAHTGDHLMACWICREAARKGERGGSKPKRGRKRGFIQSGGGF